MPASDRPLHVGVVGAAGAGASFGVHVADHAYNLAPHNPAHAERDPDTLHGLDTW